MRRSGDPRTRAVLRGPAEGHDDPRPAQVYFFPATSSYPKSLQQGVALTGRNTTGPLCAAPWSVTLHMRCVTDDADRKQTSATVTSLALLNYV